jgi:hypothetical protein
MARSRITAQGRTCRTYRRSAASPSWEPTRRETTALHRPSECIGRRSIANPPGGAGHDAAPVSRDRRSSALGRRCRIRMANSVSSPPSGRVPRRPCPSVNPDQLEHVTPKGHVGSDEVRTGARTVGSPSYLQPTTESNLGGRQSGRARPPRREGRPRRFQPRRPIRIRRPGARANRGRCASSSRNATTSPMAWFTPAFQAPDSLGRPLWKQPSHRARSPAPTAQDPDNGRSPRSSPEPV